MDSKYDSIKKAEVMVTEMNAMVAEVKVISEAIAHRRDTCAPYVTNNHVRTWLTCDSLGSSLRSIFTKIANLQEDLITLLQKYETGFVVKQQVNGELWLEKEGRIINLMKAGGVEKAINGDWKGMEVMGETIYECRQELTAAGFWVGKVNEGTMLTKDGKSYIFVERDTYEVKVHTYEQVIDLGELVKNHTASTLKERIVSTLSELWEQSSKQVSYSDEDEVALHNKTDSYNKCDGDSINGLLRTLIACSRSKEKEVWMGNLPKSITVRDQCVDWHDGVAYIEGIQDLVEKIDEKLERYNCKVKCTYGNDVVVMTSDNKYAGIIPVDVDEEWLAHCKNHMMPTVKSLFIMKQVDEGLVSVATTHKGLEVCAAKDIDNVITLRFTRKCRWVLIDSTGEKDVSNLMQDVLVSSGNRKNAAIDIALKIAENGYEQIRLEYSRDKGLSH